MSRVKQKVVNFHKLRFIPASHENRSNPGVLKKVLFHSDDIPKDLKIQMINWARLGVRRKFAAHYHGDMDEIFILINGSAIIRINKIDYSLKKGDSVYIPYACVHEMKNTSKEELDYIVIGLSRNKKGKTVNV